MVRRKSRRTIQITKYCLTTCALFLACGSALGQERKSAIAVPDQFEIGRHTFFDFGPPFDFYELFVVRSIASGASIGRLTLTPVGDKCFTPAKVETVSAVIHESVRNLFDSTNPCSIPERALRRELKRRKKSLVFSGANVTMQVQCGSQTRLVRADILDRDMFDAAPHTPEHTSWTMSLLDRLEQAVGPGVLNSPIFPTAADTEAPPATADSAALQDLAAGKYDGLFQAVQIDRPKCIALLRVISLSRVRS